MSKLIVAAVFFGLIAQAQPASASTLEVVGAVAKAGYEIYNAYLRDELTLEQARDEILAEIAASRTEIMNHMDNLAAIQARTCTTQAVSDFERFDEYVDDGLRQLVARDMEHCVFLLNDTIAAVQDQAVADELGFAIHAIGPMALITLNQIALSSAYVRDDLIAAESIIDDALLPSCRSWRVCEPGVKFCENIIRCVAYNGDTGSDVSIGTRPDRARTIAQALRNTSAPISSGLSESIVIDLPVQYEVNLPSLNAMESEREGD